MIRPCVPRGRGVALTGRLFSLTSDHAPLAMVVLPGAADPDPDAAWRARFTAWLDHLVALERWRVTSLETGLGVLLASHPSAAIRPGPASLPILLTVRSGGLVQEVVGRRLSDTGRVAPVSGLVTGRYSPEPLPDGRVEPPLMAFWLARNHTASSPGLSPPSGPGRPFRPAPALGSVPGGSGVNFEQDPPASPFAVLRAWLDMTLLSATSANRTARGWA